MSPKYRVGIDLGTTHSALAYAACDGQEPAQLLAIPQLVERTKLQPQTLLPSFLYFAHESEGPCALPWDESRQFAVGSYARARGVEAPLRVVASAKSWLGHPTLDRRSGILPQHAPADVERISPVEASYRYLDHLAEAFRAAVGEELSDQEVVLTVPASFDAAARELTVEAAMAAGFDSLTLLEEPQAALYAYLREQGDAFRSKIQVGDVILVVDVGGGTTDFSAICVRERDGNFELERVAVGDHILLGGDNMDLALAHVAKQKLAATGKELDKQDLASLGYACRSAKEKLLDDSTLESAPIALASRGSQLMGHAMRTELTQADVSQVLVEGFFPKSDRGQRPAVRVRAGLRELGLPYATDAAVTRHLAAFLHRQAKASGGDSELLCPTAVLFNGGVMKSERLRARLMETLTAWLTEVGAAAPRVLDGADLDHAVAEGAVGFAQARAGSGLRIRGGTARAYYVGIESAAPAVPGMEPPQSALCVASFGMEEGRSADLELELGIVVGEPVTFRFFGSSTRRDDTVGSCLEDAEHPELTELSPIAISLPEGDRQAGELVAVRLRTSVTEIGTLLLEAIALDPASEDERWKIELSVREP